MRIRPSVFAAAIVVVAAGSSLLAQQAEKTEEKDKPKTEEKWNVNAPPGEAATVAIDTRSGTWMSVDVSPDGRTLVFDLLGDLYTLPIEGGEATSLTHSIAWEMQARFSPDGKRIAYLSDAGGGDNVWTMDADGKNSAQVTKEDFRLVNNPVWHPSGEYIAARKHFTGTRSLGSGEIWLYHRSGGKGIALNEKPNWQKDLGEPAFAPDARYLYFSQDTSPGRTYQYNRNARGEIYSIQRLDLERGTIEPFVTGPGGAVRPVPSPDGKTLAFVRRLHGRSALFTMDLATGEERPVFEGLERDLQEAWAIQGVYPAFGWTPDSRELVVWGQGKLWRISIAGGPAREIPFHVKDTREVRKAVRFTTAVAPDRFDVRQLRWATVSPDGGRVVYSALGRLYLKELPAGSPRRLTKTDDRFELFPSFSRDGARVVFATWNDESAGSVRTLELATGRETSLTKRAGLYLEPRFSPDGRSVVYTKSRGSYLLSPWPGGETGVFRVAADGTGEPARITHDGQAPQFGAASDRVYVTRRAVKDEVELSSTLVSLSLDGNDAREVVKTETATEFAVSPDGNWLAFVEGYQAFVAALPRTGKRVDLGPKAESVPLRRLSANAGEYLHWSGDSRRLHYSLGDELFTAGLEQSFAFVPGAPAELPKPPEQGVRIGFAADADKPKGALALTGARIVTMRGDEVIEDGVIVVRDNRIAAVGRRGAVLVPAGASSIDVSGKTIVPGLVDAHWHGAMGEDEVIPQQSWIDFASLALGVTTLHDPSNDTSEIFSHAELQRAGLVVAPRIFSTGTILYGAKASATATVASLADATTHLKRLRAGGAFSVKSYNQPRREQRQQVLEAARQTRMLVVPEGGSLFQLNMNMIVDGHTGIEHSLPVPNVYDDVKQLWSQTDVGYTPTLGVAYGGLDGDHYFTATTDVWKHPLLSRYVPRPLLEA
ncbi:MAG: amidohydrolase, partial [Vicinamibacterales bacterium]